MSPAYADRVSTPERTTTGKGRPTPKRSSSSRRPTGPVAPPPLNCKEAAQRQRDEAKAARERVKQSGAAGDERYLAKRDQGAVRAAVRDTVDARRSLGVLLLPLALLIVLAQISGNRQVLNVAFTLWVLGLLAIFVDAVVTLLAVRRAVREVAPDEDRLLGHLGYGFLRSTVIRRWRAPKPRVSPPRLLPRR